MTDNEARAVPVEAMCDDHEWVGQGECPECKVNDDVAFPRAVPVEGSCCIHTYAKDCPRAVPADHASYCDTWGKLGPCNCRAVPVEGDRERLAALLREGRVIVTSDMVEWLIERGVRVSGAGASLTGSGLREAAQAWLDYFDTQSAALAVDEAERALVAKVRAALSGESDHE